MSKKPILLMNHSLLSKKDWCETAPNSINKETGETWKQKAYREAVELLCRKPFEQVPDSPADYGNRFENQVYRDAHRPAANVKGSENYLKVVNMVRGGVFQKFHTKDMELDDVILRWYGILDVEFGDSIIDLKTTGKFSAQKYTDSGQDLIYRYLTGKEKFKYLISTWDKFPKIKSVNEVPGFNLDQSCIEGYLKKQAEEFISWLKDLGYYDLYLECYSHMGKGWKTGIAAKGPDQAEKLEAFYQPYRDKFLTQFEPESEGF